MPIVQSYLIYLIKYVKIKIYSFILEKKTSYTFSIRLYSCRKKIELSYLDVTLYLHLFSYIKDANVILKYTCICIIYILNPKLLAERKNIKICWFSFTNKTLLYMVVLMYYPMFVFSFYRQIVPSLNFSITHKRLTANTCIILTTYALNS